MKPMDVQYDTTSDAGSSARFRDVDLGRSINDNMAEEAQDDMMQKEIRPVPDQDETVLLAGQLLLDQDQAGARSLTSTLQELITRAASSLSLSRRRDLNMINPLLEDQTMSTAARAISGLQFISNSNMGEEGWAAIKKRFEALAIDGLLPRSRFGQCIGISEKKFGEELYDALVRKKGIDKWMISKDQLKQFWEQLTDQRFDSRFRTFFDMVDKNADGRITKDEVQQIISLSASTNELSKIQRRADEYAAFLMEELDPDGRGYVELYFS